MGTSNYSDEFKRDAVQQIEVARRLGVSSYSFCKRLKLFGEPVAKSVGVDHEAENRRLKRELARVTEERDVLPNVPSAVVRVSVLALGTRAGCVCRFGERCRDLVPDRAVWAMLVVVSAPSLHLFGRVFKAHEPVAVQAFRPEPAIERLDESVVGWLAGP